MTEQLEIVDDKAPLELEEKRQVRDETIAKLEDFLVAYEKVLTQKAACEQVGLSYNTLFWHKKNNKDFADKFELAREKVSDAIEAEAIRRAFEGDQEPQFYRGEVVGYIQRKSDRILEKLMEGARPEKYARQKMEVTGKDGKPLTPEIDDVVLARRIAWLLTKASRGHAVTEPKQVNETN